MENLGELFVVGAVGFWVAVGLLALFIVIFSEEDGVKATVTVIIGSIILSFITKTNLITLIEKSPLKLLLYAGIYICIGLVYSVIKWWQYVESQRRQYNRLFREFSEYRNIESRLTPSQKLEWADYLKSYFRVGRRSIYVAGATSVIPNVAENKSAIIRWMTYWPFNLLWTLLNDPIRRLFEFLYERIGAKLQAMAQRAFRGTENHFLTAEEQATLEADRIRNQRDTRN